MVAIINYGLSNLLSIKRAVDLYTNEANITNNYNDVKKADKIILPGVGSFHYGMDCLVNLGLTDIIVEMALEGIPILGICLGMQMLFEEGDEGGLCEGLKLIPGRVEKIPEDDICGHKQNIPHIGWEKILLNANDLNTSDILKNILSNQEFYFVHSYEVRPKYDRHNIANVKYGGRNICAVAKKDNILGCQFHPEKSGPIGLKIIQNFICG